MKSLMLRRSLSLLVSGTSFGSLSSASGRRGKRRDGLAPRAAAGTCCLGLRRRGEGGEGEAGLFSSSAIFRERKQV